MGLRRQLGWQSAGPAIMRGSQEPVSKPSIVVHVCSPSTGEAELGQPLRLLASKSSQISEFPLNNRHCLKKLKKVIEESTWS